MIHLLKVKTFVSHQFVIIIDFDKAPDMACWPCFSDTFFDLGIQWLWLAPGNGNWSSLCASHNFFLWFHTIEQVTVYSVWLRVVYVIVSIILCHFVFFKFSLHKNLGRAVATFVKLVLKILTLPSNRRLSSLTRLQAVASKWFWILLAFFRGDFSNVSLEDYWKC